MRRTFLPIFIFVTLQVASIAVLTLWIVWSANARTHVMWLLQGIFLMLGVSGGATIIFIYWTKLRLLDTERVNFISSVSHELLTPLSSVKLYLDTLQMREELTVQQRQHFLQLMQTDTDRLTSLIREILAASRIERRKTRYTYEECDIGQQIHNYLEHNRIHFQNAEILLNLQEHCLCRIDPDSFHMIIKNLLQNALRYSQQPAHISIDLRRSGNNLLLSISDNGEGIQRKDLKKIFRLFYRASQKKGGTGLGLYIVKNIVCDHKGKVWAESSGRDSGATFKIVLPSA